jgi:hypothetical protein
VAQIKELREHLSTLTAVVATQGRTIADLTIRLESVERGSSRSISASHSAKKSPSTQHAAQPVARGDAPKYIAQDDEVLAEAMAATVLGPGLDSAAVSLRASPQFHAPGGKQHVLLALMPRGAEHSALNYHTARVRHFSMYFQFHQSCTPFRISLTLWYSLSLLCDAPS